MTLGLCLGSGVQQMHEVSYNEMMTLGFCLGSGVCYKAIMTLGICLCSDVQQMPLVNVIQQGRHYALL